MFLQLRSNSQTKFIWKTEGGRKLTKAWSLVVEINLCNPVRVTIREHLVHHRMFRQSIHMRAHGKTQARRVEVVWVVLRG
jgi:hypothetical protein